MNVDEILFENMVLSFGEREMRRGRQCNNLICIGISRFEGKRKIDTIV